MVSLGQCGDIWLALMIVQWLRMIDVWDNVDYHLLRIMIVPVHHCLCLNVCMYRSWHVLVYQSAHRHAWVFCKHTSASDWCHVPQYNKCLACSCCVLFGTDRNLSSLLINKLGIIQRRQWSSGVGNQTCHWDKNYLTNVLKSFSLSLYSNYNVFFISTSQPDSNSTSFLLLPDLPYDLWLGQCSDADL